MRQFLLFILYTTLCVGSLFADSIDAIISRDRLRCGISTGLVGFSALNEQGEWQGFDVDFCRAIASALLGDSEKVVYVPLTAKTRFSALQGGEVDILIRNTTWNFTRDTTLGVAFSVVNFYDGQGFMLQKSLGVKRLEDLAGASICVTQGTTSERNLADYFYARNIPYKAVYFDRADQMSLSYDAGRCDVVSADMSALAGLKTLMRDPSEHVILPDIISKEPLALAVRNDDLRLLKLSRWVVWGMLAAEELGLTRENIEAKIIPAGNLLALDQEACAQLSVSEQFVYRVIKQVGNYAEVFERNLGTRSPLGLDRASNALSRDGGLQYAPPFY